MVSYAATIGILLTVLAAVAIAGFLAFKRGYAHWLKSRDIRSHQTLQVALHRPGRRTRRQRRTRGDPEAAAAAGASSAAAVPQRSKQPRQARDERGGGSAEGERVNEWVNSLPVNSPQRVAQDDTKAKHKPKSHAASSHRSQKAHRGSPSRPARKAALPAVAKRNDEQQQPADARSHKSRRKEPLAAGALKHDNTAVDAVEHNWDNDPAPAAPRAASKASSKRHADPVAGQKNTPTRSKLASPKPRSPKSNKDDQAPPQDSWSNYG